MLKSLAGIALAAVALLGLGGCAPSSIEVTTDTVIVDVRTSGEYAAGHLDGAINIDVQQPDFDALITELPLDGSYIVYCASGNRSASAVARMEGLGFTAVTDGGGMSSASSSTGIEIVPSP